MDEPGGHTAFSRGQRYGREFLARMVGMADLLCSYDCGQRIYAKRKRSELVGLVKGLTAEKAVQPIPFVKTPEFYGILSIIIFIALNIYFW